MIYDITITGKGKKHIEKCRDFQNVDRIKKYCCEFMQHQGYPKGCYELIVKADYLGVRNYTIHNK